MNKTTRDEMIDAIVDRYLDSMGIDELRNYFRLNETESLEEWSDEIIQIEYEESRQ